MRETYEECNINILKSPLIRDLGTFRYLKSKDLHLYLVVITYDPKLKCNSTFIDEKTKKEVFEMIDFKWIGIEEYQNYFGKNLKRVFDEAIPIVKQHIHKQKGDIQ